MGYFLSAFFDYELALRHSRVSHCSISPPTPQSSMIMPPRAGLSEAFGCWATPCEPSWLRTRRATLTGVAVPYNPTHPTILHDHVPHGHPPSLCGHDQDAVGHLPNARSGASCAHLIPHPCIYLAFCSPRPLMIWLCAWASAPSGSFPFASALPSQCHRLTSQAMHENASA